MLKLDYISSRGEVLPLSHNKLFHITNVDGMTAADTSISSTVIGGRDGDTVNSIQAVPRTIILDLRIRSGVNVEYAKREILKVVKLYQQGNLIWTQNERTVTISGKVEAVDMSRWTNAATMQITLHCEQPFWEDIDNIVEQINEAINLHYFTNSRGDMLYFPEEGIPFGEYDAIRAKTFYNAGDVASGLEITILAHGPVTNPIIYDQNGNYFGLGYETETVKNPFTMKSGDNVIITTHKGRKTVKHNGVDVYDKIKPYSTWLQLEAGNNEFSINSDDESISNMSFSIIFKQRYI